MPELTPLDDNRQEHFLNGEDLEPITRREHFYAGRESELPAGHQEPETREEWFIQKYRGGGGDVTVVPLSVTDNGTYSEEGKAYSPVSVDVPLPQNAYLLKSVANLPQAIASFNDGAEMVMPSLKVAIEPQQEGSGDPSPTNIRPISGWDECNVTRTGKNLFNSELSQGGVYPDSGNNYSSNIYVRTDFIALKKGTYTISQNIQNAIRFYDKDKKYNRSKGVETFRNTNTITLDEDGYIKIVFRASDSSNITPSSVSDIQLEVGDTATTYEPYNGSTYTIDLDGTRYGGEVDVVSGEGTDRLRYVDMGDITWSYDGNGIFFVNNLSGLKLNGDAISSVYATTKSYLTVMSTDGTLWVSDARNQLVVHNNVYTSASDFKQAMSGVQLVYELATPLTIQLTPTAVKSQLGQNNIWADTGDITDAEYFSKEV